MPGPQYGQDAYQSYLESAGILKPKQTKGGLEGFALKVGKEYGLPLAVGAGAGFLAGGPIGAAIGAGTALGSAFLAPRAAAALPQGTPDWARTATEFGIYGFGAPLGLGGGARIAARGLPALAERLAIPEALKIAGLSAAGSVGGKYAAQALGAPESIGEIVGSLAAPTAGPMYWRVARRNLYNVAEGAEPGIKRNIAEAMGATAENTARQNVVRVTVASRAHNIEAARSQAEQGLKRAAAYSTQFDDEQWRLLSGGWNREDLNALAQGHLVGADKQLAMTPEYVTAQRDLRSINRQRATAQLVEAQTNARLQDLTGQVSGATPVTVYRGTTAGRAASPNGGIYEGSQFTTDPAAAQVFAERAAKDAQLAGETGAEPHVMKHDIHPADYTYAQDTGPGGTPIDTYIARQEGLPSLVAPPTQQGELVHQKNFWEWHSADGTVRMIPDDVAKSYQETQAAAVAAEGQRSKLDTRLAEHLGVEPGAVPASPEEQVSVLRTKFLGGNPPETPPVPARADAARLRDQINVQERAFKIEQAAKVTASTEQSERLAKFADYLEANGENLGGAFPPGTVSEASRLLEFYQKQEGLLHDPKTRLGFKAARESMETLPQYARWATVVSQSEGDPAAGLIRLKDMLANPRGTVHVLEPGNVVSNRTLVGVNPPEGADPAAAWESLRTGTLLPGWTADVRSQFQAADQADRVPFENLVMRYGADQLAARATEWGDASQKILDGSVNARQRAVNERVLAQFPQPEATSTEQFFPTKAHLDAAIKAAERRGVEPPSPNSPIMEQNRDAAYHSFMSLMVPEKSTVEGRFLTLEQQMTQARGFEKLMTMDLGHATGLQQTTVIDATLRLAQSMKERVTNFFPNADAKSLIDAIPIHDPLHNILELLGQGSDSLEAMFSDVAAPRLNPSTLQAFAHKVTGEVVTAAPLQELLHIYLNSTQAAANFTGATRGNLLMQYYEAAAVKAGKATTFLGSIGDAIRNKSLSDVHLLSRGRQEAHDAAMQALDLAGAARNTNNPFGPLAAAWANDLGKKWGDAKLGQVIDYIAGRPDLYIADPFISALFPKLARDPEAQAFRQAWRFYDQHAQDITTVLHATPLSNARNYMMQVAKEWRSSIDQGVLKGKNMSIFQLADQVFTAADKHGVPGKLLTDMLVTGDEASMAGSIAHAHAAIISQVVDSLKALAPGNDVTREDLLFGGGDWHIRSLNKFPAGMQSSLDGFAKIMSGSYEGLGDMARWSQLMAMGVLALDQSVIGIHGMKYLAQTVLAGHPVQAVTVLGRGLTTIMTDHGFYTWLKQDYDDISYMSQHGMTGGLSGYIAGPDISKMPLENLPFLGRGVSALRQISDLQFNRALLYWKVDAIRMNLDFAKEMKLMSAEFHQKFVDSSPDSLQAKIVADMGGFDAYRFGATDDLADATIRQVQNSLGGIDLRAKGISPRRQAIEQIAFIVPGFTRAQIGQWASIITKPNTLEGWMAGSMVAREALFAGGVAMGMSRLLGTSHLMNFDDPSKPDWLAVKLPEGGYISTMSTMAIPRLLSRAVNETVNGAAGQLSGEGGGFNYQKSLESFAQGRLSPGASALYDAFTNKDFLGRTYTSNLDKWTSTLEKATLPIVAQSVIDDIKESLRQGGVDMHGLLLDSGAQIIGKNYVPEAPVKKLNAMATQAYQTDWNLLTDAQKYALRQSNPGIAPAEAEYNFFSKRRATTESAHIDAAYQRYGDTVDHTWHDPVTYQNMTSSQADDDKMLQAGQIDGNMWRDRYHRRQDVVSDAYANLTSELAAEGVNLDKVKQQKLQRIAKAHDPNDVAWLLQLAKSEYAGVRPDNIQRTLSTPGGDVTVGEVDWDKFTTDRANVLKSYPADIQKAVLAGAPDRDPGVQAYQQAGQTQKLIESTPRYRGLSNEQGDKLDAMRSVMVAVRAQITQSLGLPAGAAAPAGLAQAAQSAGLQALQKYGLLLTRDDMSLATMAVAMGNNAQLAEQLMNPAQYALILQNPETVRFFPYLQYRVPRALRTKLPVQPIPAIEAKLALGQLGG